MDSALSAAPAGAPDERVLRDYAAAFVCPRPTADGLRDAVRKAMAQPDGLVRYRTTITLFRNGNEFTSDPILADADGQAGTKLAGLNAKMPWKTCGSVDWIASPPALPEAVTFVVDNPDAVQSLRVPASAVRGASHVDVPVDMAGSIVSVDASDPTAYVAHVEVSSVKALDPHHPVRALYSWSASAAYRPAPQPVDCQVANTWVTPDASDGLSYLHANLSFAAHESLVIFPSEFFARVETKAGAEILSGYNHIAPPYMNDAKDILPSLLLTDPSAVQHMKFQVDPAHDLGFVSYLEMSAGEPAKWTVSFQMSKGVAFSRLDAISWGNMVRCAFAAKHS